MRALPLAVLSFATGCSFQTPVADNGGVPGDDMPGVDAALPDPDAGGTPTENDQDGDGVLDIADNCPAKANAEQWNEDGDALGDVCDPCPQHAAAQADTDGDGIGDDCDPRPTMAGDTLVLFDGFNVAGGLPAGASKSGAGSWAVSDGELRYTAGGNNAGFLLWTITAGDHTVDTRVTVGATVNTTKVVAAITDATANLGHFYMCSFSVYESLFRLAVWSGGWADLGNTGGASGTSYAIVTRSQAGNQSCRIGTNNLSNGAASGNGSQVGLRSINVSATFPYLAVYRSP